MTDTVDPMLRQLLETTASLAFEEYGVLRLMDAEWPERRCQLRFRLWPGSPPAGPEESPETIPVEEWIIECADVRASRIVMEWIGGLDLEHEHQLLWPYRDGLAQLAFHGRPADAGAVVAAMWARHLAMVGGWIPFGEYLNVFDPAAPLVSLLAAGGGVIANGPRPLMEAYAEVLRDHQLDARLLVGPRLGLAEGEPNDFAILLFGKSYVIGSGFTARRT